MKGSTTSSRGSRQNTRPTIGHRGNADAIYAIQSANLKLSVSQTRRTPGIMEHGIFTIYRIGYLQGQCRVPAVVRACYVLASSRVGLGGLTLEQAIFEVN